MKHISLILLLCSCLSLTARERVFTITKGQDVSTLIITESHVNGQFTYVFDYGDSKTTKTVDAEYRCLRWDIDAPSVGTRLSVVMQDDGYHIDGTYKGKTIHKVIKKGTLPWMQNMGYCAGHMLRPGQSFEYMNISLHDVKAYEMRVVYVGEEVRDGMNVYHFYLTPCGLLSKFWKAHYYYDKQTGDLVASRAVEGFPGTPETVWTLQKN